MALNQGMLAFGPPEALFRRRFKSHTTRLSSRRTRHAIPPASPGNPSDIVPQSLLGDMQQLYKSRQKKGAQPWDLPELKPGGGSPEVTLFSQRYLTVVVDEVHEMRNLGLKHLSGLRIFQQGTLKLALTATPLLTAPKVCQV